MLHGSKFAVRNVKVSDVYVTGNPTSTLPETNRNRNFDNTNFYMHMYTLTSRAESANGR